MEKLIGKYDLIIIGGGVAGVFGTLKIAENHKHVKTLLIDLCSFSAKRRRQLEGWLGVLMNSDGKWKVNDAEQILAYVDGRTVKAAEKFVLKHLEEAGPLRITKNKMPNANIKNKADKLGLEITLHDYIQWKPENIHQLSKNLTPPIEESKNIDTSFNNEVYDIVKVKGGFHVETEEGVYFAKKVILNAGRSGFRWVTKIYNKFGITLKNDIACYGITVETQANNLKDFNKAHCTLKNESLTLGPLQWNGTVIPVDFGEDRGSQLVTAGHRSNEARWHSDKVSFNLLKNIPVEEGLGIKEVDRVAKLAYLLNNDRVGKEKVRAILKKQATISQLPEYDWLIKTIEELTELFPVLTSKANFHTPCIREICSEIRLDSDLQTEIPGLYIAGESAGFEGILGAAISGTIAANSACK